MALTTRSPQSLQTDEADFYLLHFEKCAPGTRGPINRTLASEDCNPGGHADTWLHSSLEPMIPRDPMGVTAAIGLDL